MLKFTSLFSGSSGNSYLLESDNSIILIDAGKSGIKIEKELGKLSINPKDIDAIILTHEHSDHFQSVSILSKRHNIPIFVSSKLRNVLSFKTKDNLIFTFDSNKDFNIKDIKISPFTTSHDAIDPVGFTMEKEDKKIAIATDTGIYNDNIINSLTNSNLAVIESNYEESLIEISKYPYYLKKRIKSNKGHLSNRQMQELLKILSEKDVNKFILGHLSKENNSPDLVKQSAILALQKKANQKIYIAPRDEKGITFEI